MTAKLGELVTIAELAKRANWNKRRMLRFITRINAEHDGALLYRPEGARKFTVNSRALLLVAPMLFSDPESVRAQLDDHEQRITRVEKIAAMHGRVLAKAG